MKTKTNIFATSKRLVAYVIGHHKKESILVLFCILFSSSAVVVSSLFLETLIDDYITPMLQTGFSDFSALLHIVLLMALVFLFGALCTLIYNRVMVRISQGTLKEIRDDMFAHMQTLPIRYFDSHTHGDIMSHYTNDTDTLRQFISQSLPQLFSAVITIIVLLIAMFASSVPLTIVVLVSAILMMIATKTVGGASARYFMQQQTSLGEITGYIEEMMNGQKVIKVFCHEEQAKSGFRMKNRTLCQDSGKANKYGNILMPVIMQIGNLQYILVALIGGLLALNGSATITIGVIVAFLNLAKTFCLSLIHI